VSVPRYVTQRKRVLRRAKILQNNKHFLHVLQESRAWWNREFPEWKVTGQGAPPDPVKVNQLHQWGLNLIPASLKTSCISLGIWGEDLALEDWRANRHSYNAAIAWSTAVEQLCEIFWPAENFPSYGSYSRPMEEFVCLCLLYDPRMVSADDWIEPFGLSPKHVMVDPKRMELALGLVLEVLEDAVGIQERSIQESQVLPEYKGLSQEQVIRLIEHLRDVLGHDNRERQRRLRQLFPDERSYCYLPLPFGTTTDDYRKAIPEILQFLNVPVDGGFEAHRIREMHAEGKSKSEIARLLGVSRQTVINVLRQEVSKTRPETDILSEPTTDQD
jgi:hypothetical protein